MSDTRGHANDIWLVAAAFIVCSSIFGVVVYMGYRVLAGIEALAWCECGLR